MCVDGSAQMAAGKKCDTASRDDMPRVKLPPDDLADWLSVPISVAWADSWRDNDINRWLHANVIGRWYVRDGYLAVRGFDAMQKVYSFEDHGEGMAFAMTWT